MQFQSCQNWVLSETYYCFGCWELELQRLKQFLSCQDWDSLRLNNLLVVKTNTNWEWAKTFLTVSLILFSTLPSSFDLEYGQTFLPSHSQRTATNMTSSSWYSHLWGHFYWTCRYVSLTHLYCQENWWYSPGTHPGSQNWVIQSAFDQNNASLLKINPNLLKTSNSKTLRDLSMKMVRLSHCCKPHPQCWIQFAPH